MIWNFTRELPATAVQPRTTPAPSATEAYEAGRKYGRSETDKEFAGLSPSQQRKRLRALRKEIGSKRCGLDKSISEMDAELNRLSRVITAFTDLDAWGRGFLRFQKPSGSLFHELRKAVSDRTVLDLNDWRAKTPADDYEQELFQDANVFVIEHDWWSAINKAEEFAGGSFRLPFDICIFEFVISGRPVIALATNYGELIEDPSRNEILMQIAVKSLVGWAFSVEIYSHSGDGWTPIKQKWDDPYTNLVRLLGEQIKAACVALEAEVATSTMIRAPHAGAGRERTEFPPVEYRTISLRKKARAAELPGGTGKPGRRLHFRRGHWRHLPTLKTWVRWTMVGDPDLGFIEKEYRL